MAAFNTIDEILEDLRRGKMAVIMDDEDRENEGDLIMAADSVRPQDVNFMARYGRGLICLTLTRERCRQLRLPPRAPAAHGERYRQHASHQLHPVDRGGGGRDHGDIGT